VWIAGNRGIRPATESASIKVVLPLAGVDQDKDDVFAALDRISVAERAKDLNKLPYKPELLAKVKDLEVRHSQEAPAFYCKPAGVPRMGPPARIIQLPDKYATNLFRLVPLDATHRTDIDTSYSAVFHVPVGAFCASAGRRRPRAVHFTSFGGRKRSP
jgi:hypothetical protein